MTEAFNPVELAKLTLKDAVQDVVEFRGETTIVIDAAKIIEACTFFRDTEGLEYNFLEDVTGVDYYPEEPRFAVCYHLYSMVFNRSLRLKVYLPSDDPRVPSVCSIWAAANYQEREAYDLLGIIFEGHPDLRRILMPADWDGHPQRKDYPLGYEQVQFSFNYDDINRIKPYAKE
ncbi:MAG: NADH-quinone oxidoreductase subunit C [Anaerolineae bacterium]|nr:NADH-quinone oxidoreductase subunit C [Anaerolineae bacterium]